MKTKPDNSRVNKTGQLQKLPTGAQHWEWANFTASGRSRPGSILAVRYRANKGRAYRAVQAAGLNLLPSASFLKSVVVTKGTAR